MYKLYQEEVAKEKERLQKQNDLQIALQNAMNEEITEEVEPEPEKFYELNTHKVRYALYNPSFEGLHEFRAIYKLVVHDNLWINNDEKKPKPVSEKTIRRDLDVIKKHLPDCYDLIKGEKGCYKSITKNAFPVFTAFSVENSPLTTLPDFAAKPSIESTLSVNLVHLLFKLLIYLF